MANEFVVMGATLKCPHGSANSKLMVLPINRVLSGGKPKANIGDAKPFVNILPFGTCKSMANPTVAAATAAAQGVLQQMPCTPLCVMWIPSKVDVLIGCLPALMDNDKLICTFGAGVIEISDSGQGPAVPAIPTPPSIPIFAALMYLDVLLNIIKGIQRIESWDQVFAILKEFGAVIGQMVAGAMLDSLLGMVPAPLGNDLKDLIDVVEGAEKAVQTFNQLNEADQSIKFLAGVNDEFLERGYSSEEASREMSGKAIKCDPAVNEALGTFAGGGRK